MSLFHAIYCTKKCILCNNCRLSNVMEILQLLHKNCSTLRAINCTQNHVLEIVEYAASEYSKLLGTGVFHSAAWKELNVRDERSE